jgi:multiple sugar transport system permease protein
VAARRQSGIGWARVRPVLIHLALAASALVMLYPVIWMVVSSLRPGNEIFRDPGILVKDLKIENYRAGWNALTEPFTRYLLNSAVVVLGAIIGNLVSCSMAAYAFARLEFSGKKFWFAIMLLTIMLPIHVVIVPQYILFSHLGWINTFLPLIVPKFLATDAFFVFLMVQFIRSIPVELDDAARIDGCGAWGIYRRIILPLLSPALVTTAIFSFIWTWNNFFSQLIYLSTRTRLTVPVALRGFLDATGSSEWGALFAMSVVTLVPVVVVFVVFQRRILAGMAHTGLK